MKTLFVLSVLVVLGCSLPDGSEAPTESSQGAAPGVEPGDRCYLVAEKTRVAGCATVVADEWSSLVTCEGAQSTDNVFSSWPGGATELTSFTLPSGGCFQYYECSDNVSPPTVSPCP